MVRNDYRRALIMMRSLRAGVSGYVRLERRTLIGTMQFTVTGARERETLYALLLYQLNGLWYAQPLGQLGLIRYGQSGLVYRFDPRDIEGRALEDYTLVAVASLSDEGVCDLVLAGFLNGSRVVDWPQVRQAICESFAVNRVSERPLPEPMGAPIPPIAAPSPGDAVTLPTDKDEYPVEDGAGDAVTLPTDKDEYPVEDGAGGAVMLPTDKDEYPVEDGAGDAVTLPTDRDERPVEEKASGQTEAAPEESRPTAAEAAEATQTEAAQPEAAESHAIGDNFDIPARARHDAFDTPARLGQRDTITAGQAAAELDMNVETPWPDCIEPLRALFKTRPSCRPFEAEGFVLIKAPIAEATGVDHCIAGLSCAQGKAQSVLYGIPARYTPEPPPGLEGYSWQGDTNSGYWVIVRPVC